MRRFFFLNRQNSDGLQPVKEQVMKNMVDMNVVQLKKGKDGQNQNIKIDEPSKCIKLAAQMQQIDLTTYGISPAVAATMDTASQVDTNKIHV
jgi:hypothetical protein